MSDEVERFALIITVVLSLLYVYLAIKLIERGGTTALLGWALILIDIIVDIVRMPRKHR